ncbi:hypothetical protein [Sphingopyxis sp.]|uniref:hypothetical protein n=1 Tax=Sphingopyxis sp. TaxID=1908224 RepID=UPI0014851681|nr:hypothetical protein [Sphingopyxis sp.]MBR2172111.1 hypothetical protein [Sphingopyxis sp.]
MSIFAGIGQKLRRRIKMMKKYGGVYIDRPRCAAAPKAACPRLANLALAAARQSRYR